MDENIFREYDIRGTVGVNFDVTRTRDLARALAVFFKESGQGVRRVAVGMDGRTHSGVIKDELVEGLRESGFDVVFLGMCPTPVMYFSQFMMSVDAGVMITASHNPPTDNGFKICLKKKSVWGKQLVEIRDLFKAGACVKDAQRGGYEEVDGVGAYVEYLVNEFRHLEGMDLGVVIDCANAVGGLVMPKVAEKLLWKRVRFLYTDVDGTFPNHEADPVVEENMTDVKRVLRDDPSMDLGVGFDGDCDRMAPMTKDGYLVPGDAVLAVLSKHLLKKHPGAAVVFDVRVSATLIELLNQWGARACISPCGHSIIKDAMQRENALLAGELSCHFFFKDRYFGYDDGIYAALRLFEMILETGASFEELVSVVPRRCSTPEIIVPCADEKKRQVVDMVKQFFASRVDTNMITIDGVRVTVPHGWGLVRASNTRPALTMRFEADSPERLREITSDFKAVLEPFFAREVLEKQFNR